MQNYINHVDYHMIFLQAWDIWKQKYYRIQR